MKGHLPFSGTGSTSIGTFAVGGTTFFCVPASSLFFFFFCFFFFLAFFDFFFLLFLRTGEDELSDDDVDRDLHTKEKVDLALEINNLNFYLLFL